MELPALVLALLIAVAGVVVSAVPSPPAVVCTPGAFGCVPPEGAVSNGLYVDAATPAARQVREWEAAGRTADADRMRQIAGRAVPLWVTGEDEVVAQVDGYVGRAAAIGAVPVLVAYNIPDRDCGSFSGGGAADAAGYRRWVDAVAAGLGGRDAVVVLEPDALPHQLTGCAGIDGTRFELLAGAVDVFTAAGARVYIDAGNPGFVPDLAATATALDRSGIRRAAGFSLNVANFYTTEAGVAHGAALSRELGGDVRFVVDTSRNGAGKLEQSPDGVPTWCNPPGRRLGATPTLDPGIPLVDALLWIKRPGESDGTCRPGDPVAGGWDAEYALGLIP